MSAKPTETAKAPTTALTQAGAKLRQSRLSTGERRLAAIIFTDIVGYTAITQANESRAMAILDAHNAMIRPFFPEFNGREVKAIGDSFLVEFGSALDALKCAVEIQSRLHGYNKAAAEEGKIRLRIGVHLGDVIHKDGDVFGDAVNISSRIQPLAQPEGISISRQVYDQVRNKFDLPLVSMGEIELRNVSVPVEVYSVQMPWDKPMAASAAESRRVAVLPFSNMSPDPADEFFADGLTDELISTVSRIDGAEVISRTSVMQYKKFPKPIRQISSELDAGTVLEGSVRKAGNRLRVTVQMIDAGKDKHIWSESYDRTMDDVFAIQTDIAGRVAEALKSKITKETPREAGLTDSVEAYTEFLRAKQIFNDATPSQLKDVVSLLESAIAKDPGFSKAYSELALAYRHTGFTGTYLDAMKKGEAAARKALETGPDTAEAHAAMAAIHLALDKFEEAQAELQVAVRLNPNLSDAYHSLGEATGAFGRLDESLVAQRRAYALDPVSLYAGEILAETLRVSGKVDEAMEVLSKLSKLYPNNLHVAHSTAWCYISKKDYRLARQTIESAIRASPGGPDMGEMRVDIGILDALEGDRAKAIEAFDNVPPKEQTLKLGAALYIKTALGDLDGAFAALDELAQIHAWPFLVKSDPMLAQLHNDPRFADFCRKVGIPP